MKAFQEELAKLNNEQVTSLANGATVSLTVAGTSYDVDATNGRCTHPCQGRIRCRSFR